MKCKGESRIVHGIDETNLRIMLDLKRKKNPCFSIRGWTTKDASNATFNWGRS